MRFLAAISTIPISIVCLAQPASVIQPKPDGVYFAGDSVLITWNPDPGATSYSIEVDVSSLFLTPVYAYAGLSQTNLTVAPLGTGRYYVRVRSYAGQLRLTRISSFSTFTPASLTNAVAWYRGDKGLVADGSNFISEWRNQLSNFHHLQQATPSKQPTWVASGFNNRPIVSYDGSDALSTSDNVPLGAFTILGIWKATGGLVYEHSPVATSNPGCFLYTTSCASVLARKSVISSRDVSAAWGANNQLRLTSHLFDGTHSGQQLRSNGVPLSLTNSCAGSNDPGTSLTMQPFFLGSRANNSIYLNGQFGDVLIVNERLPDSTLALTEQFLAQRYYPAVDLGADVTVAYGFCNTTLAVPTYYSSYLWSTGGTGSSINITKPGTYWVRVTSPLGGTYADTIMVDHPINLLYPDPICLGETVIWDLQLDPNDYTFNWGNGNLTSAQPISGAGTYTVTVTDTNACSAVFSHTFSIDSFAAFPTLGPDKSVCAGEPIGLTDGSADVVAYQWSTGGTADTMQVWSSGSYSVTVTNANGCEAIDTISITILGGSLPQPDFTTTIPCVNDSVHFTDLSDPGGSTISAWLWKFGDGQTSTAQNPTYKYALPGTYLVELLITTATGCSNAVTIPLQVNSSPTLQLGLDGVCMGAPTNFYEFANVSPGNIVLWEWYFGDGDSSQAKNPIHVYASSGWKTASLTVTSNANCQATADTTFYVHVPPIAEFAFDSVCIGTPTTFTNETVLSPTGGSMFWLWDFGDGVMSVLENDLHQYAGTGTFAVTLTVYDNGNTCSDTISHVVSVFDLPLATFTHDDICVSTPQQFVDLSASFGAPITSWQWEFGDGEASVNQHPQHMFSDTGFYLVRLVVVNGLGCVDEQVSTVFVNPLPKPSFAFDPPYGNAPTTITFVNHTPTGDGPHTFAWYVDGVLVSTDSQPDYIFDSNGVYQVTLEATSDKGCIQSYTDSIYIVYPVLDLQVDQVIPTLQLQTDGSVLISVKAHVVNTGTIQVNHVDMLASVEFETPMSQAWEQIFFASQAAWFEFASGFRVWAPKDFVCVEVANPNGGEDANPADNRMCVPLEAQMLLANPYPNPASEHLNFLILLPDEATVTLNEFDALGRTARPPIVLDGHTGSNMLALDVSANPPGVYLYQLAVGQTVVTNKVIVAR